MFEPEDIITPAMWAEACAEQAARRWREEELPEAILEQISFGAMIGLAHWVWGNRQ